MRFKSADGLTLEAWWLPAQRPSRRAALLVHGRSGSRSEPYVIETAHTYARAGFGVLALDLRGCGRSEGHFRTAGYQEARDVQGALLWLQERGFEASDVVLHGWSSGGAAVLRVAPGHGVRAVVSEAGYASLPLLLGGLLPGHHGPSHLLSRATRLAARVLGIEFDPWALVPMEDARRLWREGIPLLIIHSRDDEVVPLEHARLIAASHRGAVLWEVGGCEHAAAYTHPEYSERLTSFLIKVATSPEGKDSREQR